MDRSEAEEMRDAETLAGLANAPSACASAGIGERPSSSGAKRKTKTRKPYTITKQREKWTDQEHSRFLDALRMYGRAWRRIEEHIGSKTAVQIRSHAQKFFSKLEKQEMSGPKGEGLPESISIPPPRPKRKPSHPYPRKPFSGVGSYDGAATAEGAGSQDQLPTQPPLPDYSHLAPKLNGNERMDVAVAAVAQAASAAAAAAAAAVISAAGEQIRAHMQACPPQCFPFFGLAPSMLAQLSLQQLNPQGMLQAAQATLPAQYSGQYSSLTPGQVGQPIAARLSKLQRSEFSGTSGDPLSAVPMRTAERRTNANGSDGNSACSREDPMAEDGRLPGDTGATSRQGSGISRLGIWPPMAQPQVPAAQQMLSELYYSWNNMTSLSAAAAAAADANSGAEAAAAAQNGDWRAVVQAAAAAASQWEVQKLNAHALQSRSNGVQVPGGAAQAAAAPLPNMASRCVRTNKMHASESKARRQGLSGSDGSGTNAAEDRVEAVGALANCDAADEESPSRDFDDSLYEPLGNKRTSGSLDTNNSNAETGMKGEGELAYQVDAEGEGSGSNPTGNGDSGNNSNEGSGGEGKRGSNKGSNSGSGNETDPCDKDGNGTSKDPATAAAPQSVRESIAGNETGGSGSGNATRVSNGATVPTGLSKQREGSDEGCTSLEHPQPRKNAAAAQAPKASAFLQHPPGAAATAAAAHDFSALNGAQGLIESAQMAQAASALQQSGLAPYLLQQQYTAQLAQLQQAAMMNWGGQKMSAFDMFNSLMGLQAMAGQPGHLPNPALSARTPANSGGAGELHSAPSGMASFDTLAYAASAAAAAAPAVALADTAAVAGLPPAGSGVLPRPPAGPAAAAAAAAAAAGQVENSSVSGSGQTQQSQGFMPYKWRHHPLPRGVHQLQPGGLLSLGKRSASASLAEPPRKRTISGNLP
ncbi:g3041 [Coccomyxa elongata]